MRVRVTNNKQREINFAYIIQSQGLIWTHHTKYNVCFTNKLYREPSFDEKTSGQTLVGESYHLLRNLRRTLPIHS